MDIYDYLKMDHEKVSHLFKLFENSKIKARKKEIVAWISKELLVHAHAEQETFYKALTMHPEGRDKALHGEEEHNEIEEQIKKINIASDSQWEEEVIALKKLVEHHVREEEGEIFSTAKKIFSKEDAIVLKEKMHYLKGTFLVWMEKKETQN